MTIRRSLLASTRLNAPYKGNHKRITDGCYDRQDEAAELYALSCLLYQDDPDDSADLYEKLQARGNLFAFADGTVLAGGAVLFLTRQNGIFTASLRRSIHFPLCRKAIECCFSAAKRLKTDVAIGDEAKALILTA